MPDLSERSRAGWTDAPPAELLALLEEFTYLPRWTFELRAGGFGPQSPGFSPYSPWVLHVATWVQNAYPPHAWGKGNFVFSVPPVYPEQAREFWLGWLHHCTDHMAKHESDEWFLVGGQRLFDPHAP